MEQFKEKAKLVKSEELAPQIFRHSYHCPQIAGKAVPGQFVMIRTAEERDPLLRRPFSIHQCDGISHIQVLFKILGRGTRLLAETAEGDEISLLGPLGHGFRLSARKKLCLVGGGMGIAPILYLTQEASRLGREKDDVVVVLGARNKEELEPLARDFGSLGYPLYLATDDGSLGHHGLVTDVLAGLDLTTGHEIHCCGPRPMMAAVHLFCRKIGVDCYVSMETAMACGMGACLGCNVPRAGGGYLHVCSDGPVFKSSELLWNL